MNPGDGTNLKKYKLKKMLERGEIMYKYCKMQHLLMRMKHSNAITTICFRAKQPEIEKASR